MSDLPLWVKGRSARAGDALKALCLALNATFRKVGPAYVLTDDLLSYGARRAVLAEWLYDAQMAISA